MKWPSRFRLGPPLLALIWLLFTVSLVGWWWIYGLRQITTRQAKIENPTQEETLHEGKEYRMILWEGGFLVLVIFVGGGALVFLTASHQRRHERLKFFFSTFAHDLKTSMTRIRLQSEILQEDPSLGNNPKLQGLLENLQRLDLQLENSLWMSSLEESRLMVENVSLRQTIASLRNEFPDLKIELNQDAQLSADQRALRVALRNLFQNSLIHGEATEVSLSVSLKGTGLIELHLSDNGKGLSPRLQSDLKNLGSALLHSPNGRSNGIGLYLTRHLLLRMQGDLQFQLNPQFVNVILLPGSVG